MYQLAFTTGFRDSLEDIPKHVIDSFNRFLEQLRADPFGKLPQAKKLKNHQDRFRARIGDFRVIYRIERGLRRIVLLTVASRQRVYASTSCGGRVLDGVDAEEVEKLLRKPRGREPFSTKAPAPASVPLPVQGGEATVEVEQVAEWITEDELALLKIPTEYHITILESTDPKSLDPRDLPQDILDRVYDYVTNPASSHIGKLYSAQDAGEIARLPLRSFMLALDKEQQRVIDRDLKSGPLLVKGGPGTGKSLVGLYRMRHIIENRHAEHLFEGSARFGIITYTNTLSDLNEGLTEEIAGKLAGNGEILCSTLDKITYQLARHELKRKPKILKEDQVVDRLTRDVSSLDPSDQEVIARIGVAYAVNEIERVILGFGVDTKKHYLEIKRTNRKVGLNERYRSAIWTLYEVFLRIHHKENVESWGLLRKIALQHLLTTPSYPRFNALFVDEVQDLSRTSRRLILNLVSDRRFLMMTADTGQSIYEYPPTWADTDPTLNLRGGRIFVLRRNYRTTRENYQAIEPLRVESSDGEGETGRPMPVYSGDLPLWVSSPGTGQASATIKAVKRLSERHELGQIAVIVRDHTQVNAYCSALNAAGIKAQAVNKQSRIDLTASQVHVITAHSSKGLEFPAVIVPDVSDETFPLKRTLAAAVDDEQVAEVVELEQRLLYVALSRACHSLVMIENSNMPSRFLELLDPKRWRDSL